MHQLDFLGVELTMQIALHSDPNELLSWLKKRDLLRAASAVKKHSLHSNEKIFIPAAKHEQNKYKVLRHKPIRTTLNVLFNHVDPPFHQSKVTGVATSFHKGSQLDGKITFA